jgi:hypothetical protein
MKSGHVRWRGGPNLEDLVGIRVSSRRSVIALLSFVSHYHHYHFLSLSLLPITISSTMSSQARVTSSGPELRGANITLDTILKPTDTSIRQTKIVCTMGPACWSVECLETLIDCGLAIARFNFSHGDHEAHKACLDRLRTAAENKGKHIGTFC